MALLFRLPLMLLELLVRRLFGGDDHVTATVVTPEAARAAATPAPPPSPSPTHAPSPPTADEALRRRAAREATEAPASVTRPRPIAGDGGHVDTGATVVESFGPADDVNGSVTVDAPWPGYDGDTAAAIAQRLRDADTATKAVVALYERANKNRTTVLRAAR